MRITINDLPEMESNHQSSNTFTMADLLTYFSARYHKTTGERFSIVKGKDHKLAKELVESIDEPMLKQMVLDFFAFSRENYSLGAFWGSRELLLADAVETLRQDRRNGTR